MPGYKQSEMFAPQPTEETKDMKSRFVLPRLSFVQLLILGLVLFVAFQYKKLDKPVLTTVTFAIALLHMYDHLFLIERHGERFLLNRSEGYCPACQK